MVQRGIECLAPYVAERCIKLGIEPFHPALLTERSVIVTLAEALNIAERFEPGEVGVVLEVYHVFWGPELYAQIQRAAFWAFTSTARWYLPGIPCWNAA